MVRGGEGTPEVDPNEDPCHCFEQMVFSTWPEANLVPVLRYLRGNKYLNLPDCWQKAMPQPFEVLQKLEQDRLAKAQG